MANKKEIGSKILNHPDKDEIIKKLVSGESVRSLEEWLKIKYPTKSNFHISFPTLQNFRKHHLNIEEQVLKDLQDIKRTQHKKENEIEKQKIIEGSSAYIEKINEVASNHLDVGKKLLELDAIIGARIKFWYDMGASGQELPQRADKEMRDFITQQMELMKNWKKMVEGQADKTIEYNINIQNSWVQDQITVIRDAVVEIVRELDTEKSMLFMAKFHSALQKLEAPKPIEVETKLLTDGDLNE